MTDADKHLPAPSATLQLLLDTTEQLIGEKGCRGTTLQDIMERTHLSKGAIYHYVTGKDELFGMILRAKMNATNERFNEVVRGVEGPDPTMPIQLIAGSMGNSSGGQDVTSKIFMYLLSQNDNPKIAAILKSGYEFSQRTAADWIRVGQQAGAIPQEVDAEKMASIFMAFVYGLRVQNLIVADSDSRLELKDIFQVLLRSLS